MSRAQNRLQMMRQLGAKQANTMWSWCAVNEDTKKVYFSVWADMVHKFDGETVAVIQEPDWGVGEGGKKSPARNDHDKKLRLVFEAGYEAYGYFVVAVDPKAHPRQIETIRTSFVMHLKLTKLEDGSIVGALVDRVEID